MAVNNRRINIDIVANANNVQAVMNTVASSVNNAGTSFTKLAPQIQKTVPQFSATVANSNLASGAVMKFGGAADDAGKKTASFGQKFADNRGIVFGVAGLSSALAEAVGMMGMYGDTQTRLKESQDALNKLVQAGVTSGKEYTDAQSEVNKQMRFANMVNRNTALSMMDNVFFLTMVVSGLQKSGIGWSKLGSIVGKVGGIFSQFGGHAQTVGGALPQISVGVSKAGASVTQFSKGLNAMNTLMPVSASLSTQLKTALMAYGPIFAVIAGGIAVIATVIEKTKSLNQDLTKIFGEQTVAISLWEQTVIQAKMTFGTATDEEIAKLKQFEKQNQLVIQAMNETGVSPGEFLISDEAKQKVLDKLEEIIDKTHETKEEIAAENKAGFLESFNEGMKDWQRNMDFARPLALEFIKNIENTKAPLEAQIEQIMAVIDAKEEDMTFSKGQADALRNLITIGVQPYIDAAKEEEKVVLSLAEKMEALNKTAEGKGILQDFLGSSIGQGKNFSQDLTDAENAIKQIADTAQLKFRDFQHYVEDGGTLSAEEFINAWKGTTPEIKAKFLELVEAAANVEKATFSMSLAQMEAAEQTSKNTQTYLEAKAAIEQWIDTTGMSTAEMIGAATVLEDTTGRVNSQAAAIRENDIAWQQMKDATIQQADASLNAIAAWAKENDRIQENLEWQFKLKDAKVQGMVAAKQWSEETELSAAAAETFRTNLIRQNAEVLKGVPVQHMLTSEIQSFITSALEPAAEKVIKYKQAIAEMTNNARSFWSSVIGAEDKKAFRDAFKDMDLGAIPRKLRDDVKDLFEGIRDDAEKGKEVETAFTAIQASMTRLGDNLSKGQIKKIFEQGVKVFERGAGSVNVFGQSVNDLILGPMTDLNKEDLYKKLSELPGTFDEITKAQADGIIDFNEYRDIFTQFAMEGGKLPDLTDEQREALAKLGIVVDENTGKIDTSKVAVQQFTEEMAKIEATAIVAETVKKMWADMSSVIIEQNALVAEHWALTMLKVNIDALTAVIDIQTYFDTDIPEAIQVSIDKARELAAGLLSIATLMQQGAGGENGFKLQNIFNDKGPGDIPSQPPSAGGPSDPFNQKGFNQLRISEDEGKGGKGGLAGQWATMLDQMLVKLQTTIESMNAEFAKLVQYWADAITVMIESNQVLHENWAENTLFIAEETSILVVEIAKTWGTLISEVDDMNQALEQAWSENMANMAQNAADAAKGITQEFEGAMEAIIDKADDMLGEWQNAMDDMVQAAADAAEDIQNEMDSIKDTESVHTIRTVRVGQSQGGIWSMAEGGISAASGLYTTNGPANLGPFHFGDNSGGRETVAFLPHDGNKADNIMDQLDAMFGRKKTMTIVGGGGERDIIVPITVNINGEQYSFTQRYRVRQGQDIANQVF